MVDVDFFSSDSDSGYSGLPHSYGPVPYCPRCGSTEWHCYNESTRQVEIPNGDGTDTIFDWPYGEMKCPNGHVYTHEDYDPVIDAMTSDQIDEALRDELDEYED